MREFNLLREQNEHRENPDEETIEREFSVDIDPELIKALSVAETPEELDRIQSHFNDIFSQGRREKMLAIASKTRLGLPAVYYRYMPRKQFAVMIEHGKHTPQDYIEREQVDESTLHAFLNTQYSEMTLGKISAEEYEAFRLLDLGEKFRRIFPEVPIRQIAALIQNRGYKEIQQFLDDHLSNQEKRLSHKVGWPGIELSNTLSASAGGPIIASGGMNRSKVVYIEFIAPDNRVATHGRDTAQFLDEHMNGDEEKEVFLKQIPLSWITRVFITRRQLIDEAINHPSSTIQQFAANHPPQDGKNRYQHWHKNAHTSDMVPVSVANRLK